MARALMVTRMGGRMRWGWLLSVYSLFFVMAGSPPARGQDTPDYFRQNCISCHTIGGGRLSP